MNAIDMRIRLRLKLHNMKFIDKSIECWLFTGHIEYNGYGRLTYKSKGYGVHVLSAHLHLGYVLGSKRQVNHKPECPNKHCFNPDHLYIGTQTQNITDYYSLVDTGLCPKGHPKSFMYEYTSKDGKMYKWCRICRSNSRAKYWLEKHK